MIAKLGRRGTARAMILGRFFKSKDWSDLLGKNWRTVKKQP